MIRGGKNLNQNEYSTINSDSSVVSLLSTDESEDDNEVCSVTSEDGNKILEPLKNEHETNRLEEKNDIIIARVLGPPCGCRRRCRSKLNKDQEIVLFSKFWSLKSKHQQNCYLYNNISIGKTQTSTLRRSIGLESRRTITVYYSVDNGSGDSVKVCKTEFMNLHGIQNSFSRMNTIIKKKKSGLAMTGNRKDRRENSFGGRVKTKKLQ